MSYSQINEKLEWYYTNYNVYKSFIICGDDAETLDIAAALHDNLHSVCTITTTDIEEEHMEYLERLKLFSEFTYRVIVVSYKAWEYIVTHLEKYVLPEQNLIVLGNMTNSGVYVVCEWLEDAKRRGFIQREDCKVLNMQDLCV